MRDGEPLYVISVASRLLQLHPQTLRKYEREGFVAPSRTTGNLRLYSAEDIERLRQVKTLVEERGVNLAGVQMALQLTHDIKALQQELRQTGRNDHAAVAGAMDDLLAQLSYQAQPEPTPRMQVEVRLRRKPGRAT